MMTIAVPAAVGLDAPMHLAIAAVLSGGLFGDHAPLFQILQFFLPTEPAAICWLT